MVKNHGNKLQRPTERFAKVKSLTADQHYDWARSLWNRIDRDRSGIVTRDELNCDEFQEVLRAIIAPSTAGAGISTYGRAEQNVTQAIEFCMRKADLNHGGTLSFEEFESFLRALRAESDPEHSAQLIFALFDLDGDLTLDMQEFREIYRYFLGHQPTAAEFQAEWDRLDQAGQGHVTQKQYVKWLQTSANPKFRQHAPPVIGTPPAAPATSPDLLDRRTAKRSPGQPARIHRPAPGLLPPSGDPRPMPPWSERFACKDPSEQNIAWRGNNRNKTLFSRPQSLPELGRFYSTYKGFGKQRRRLRSPGGSPDLIVARPKPVLSTDSYASLMSPGAERHVPGGWAEQTPRALKKYVWEPGSLNLRVPGFPPPFLYHGRDAGNLAAFS
mmetsp:Transcript_49347/g.107453  ORF Transcript_49347/g.107453 Transcript_49347/m.107453 type:complete len:385 (+) Transcript_49347:106-1260(+)